MNLLISEKDCKWSVIADLKERLTVHNSWFPPNEPTVQERIELRELIDCIRTGSIYPNKCYSPVRNIQCKYCQNY